MYVGLDDDSGGRVTWTLTSCGSRGGRLSRGGRVAAKHTTQIPERLLKFLIRFNDGIFPLPASLGVSVLVLPVGGHKRVL